MGDKSRNEPENAKGPGRKLIKENSRTFAPRFWKEGKRTRGKAQTENINPREGLEKTPGLFETPKFLWILGKKLLGIKPPLEPKTQIFGGDIFRRKNFKTRKTGKTLWERTKTRPYIDPLGKKFREKPPEKNQKRGGKPPENRRPKKTPKKKWGPPPPEEF